MQEFIKPGDTEKKFIDEMTALKNELFVAEKQYIDEAVKTVKDTINTMSEEAKRTINLDDNNLRDTIVTMRIQQNLNYAEVTEQLLSMYQMYFG